MIVLIFLLLICIIGAEYATKLHVPFVHSIFAILLILIMGLRYDVGIDYPTYEDIYNENYFYMPSIEPIWFFINDILRSIGFRSRAFFFLTSVIVVLGFYNGIRKLSPNFYISLLLFILAGFYFESANIVRQYVAMSILFSGLPCFLKGKIGKYVLWIFLAAMFHYSVLVIVPFIFLARIRYPLWLLCMILVVTFVFGNSLLNVVTNNIMPFVQDLGFYQYDVDDFDSGVNSGLLKIFYHLLVFSILLLYGKNKQKCPSFLFILINMVVIGLMIYNVCYLFTPARRLYLYFFPCIILVVPYCLNWFTKKSQVIAMGIVSCIFLLFLLKLNWGVPYNFDVAFF